MSRLAWVDASMGVSGDMLLAALHDLGAFDDGSDTATVESLGLDVTYAHSQTRVNELSAHQVTVTPGEEQPRRHLADVLALLDAATLPGPVQQRARAVFQRLATAEAAVHATSVDAVHFHEVGAVDAILDVALTCLGLHNLALDRLVVSPISLGGGSVRAAHGELAVPGPAVLALLAGSQLVSRGGPVDVELATPTGVALLAEWASASGSLPPMRVERIGVGAGTRRFDDRANVLRIVVGQAAESESDSTPATTALLIETNVDDMEPRLWPGVISLLLEAGASDAWLTPILMKKGRPAHTLSVLTPASRAADVRKVVFEQTTAIGVREQTVGKRALERSEATVAVRGQQIRVKLASYQGRVVNAQPEWEDVAAAARALPGVTEKQLLAEASGQAARLLDGR